MSTASKRPSGLMWRQKKTRKPKPSIFFCGMSCHEASTGLRPWYPSFLRRNPPKHPPSLSELRRIPLAHSSMGLRPWCSAKADKIPTKHPSEGLVGGKPSKWIQCKPRLLRRAQSRWGFQREGAESLPFGRTRGFKPCVRYNLILAPDFVDICARWKTCSAS